MMASNSPYHGFMTKMDQVLCSSSESVNRVLAGFKSLLTHLVQGPTILSQFPLIPGEIWGICEATENSIIAVISSSFCMCLPGVNQGHGFSLPSSVLEEEGREGAGGSYGIRHCQVLYWALHFQDAFIPEMLLGTRRSRFGEKHWVLCQVALLQ